MPKFGIGVYQAKETDAAVTAAVKHGYRLIDTAQFYQNEDMVGKAVHNSGVPREELFIVTKLWNNGADSCRKTFKQSLTNLGLDYVDLYLIHSPTNGGRVVETYKVMLELQKQGLIRSVGVSNFGIHHIKGLMDAGLPKPAVNQIELHPWQQKRDIVDYCRQNDIVVMGYSPMVKGQRFGDKTLVQLAKKNKKSEAQIMIRWSVQKGFITIPKSSKPERIVENSDVFDWSLDQADMDLLDSMPQRGCTWNPCDQPWEG